MANDTTAPKSEALSGGPAITAAPVLTAGNVRVGVTGALYVAPTGTAAPTDHSTNLNAAFKDLGYLSADGVTETRERSTTDITAWQNAATVRTLVTEGKITVQATLIETNADTIALYYGATVAPADGQVDIVPTATGGQKSFALDVIDGTHIIRAYIATGEVTEVGDTVVTSTGEIGYPITITAYPDSSGVAMTKWYSALIVE